MLFDRNSKEGRNIEISAGIVVGFILMGLIHAWLDGRPWQEAFDNPRIIYGLAGVATTLVIIQWNRRRSANQDHEE